MSGDQLVDEAGRLGILQQLTHGRARTPAELAAALSLDEQQVESLLTGLQSLQLAEAVRDDESSAAPRYRLRHPDEEVAEEPTRRNSARAVGAASQQHAKAAPDQHAYMPANYMSYPVGAPYPPFQPVLVYSYPAGALPVPVQHMAQGGLGRQTLQAQPMLPQTYGTGAYVQQYFMMRPAAGPGAVPAGMMAGAALAPAVGAVQMQGWGGTPLGTSLPSSMSSPTSSIQKQRSVDSTAALLGMEAASPRAQRWDAMNGAGSGVRATTVPAFNGGQLSGSISIDGSSPHAMSSLPSSGGVPIAGSSASGSTGASSGTSSRGAGDRQACAFFLKTGTCAWGNRCKFEHPYDKAPHVDFNSLGLPLRPGEPACAFYLKNLSCAFGHTCKFHHPELPGTAAAAAAAAAAGRGQTAQTYVTTPSSGAEIFYPQPVLLPLAAGLVPTPVPMGKPSISGGDVVWAQHAVFGSRRQASGSPRLTPQAPVECTDAGAPAASSVPGAGAVSAVPNPAVGEEVHVEAVLPSLQPRPSREDSHTEVFRSSCPAAESGGATEHPEPADMGGPVSAVEAGQAEQVHRSTPDRVRDDSASLICQIQPQQQLHLQNGKLLAPEVVMAATSGQPVDSN